MFFMGCLGIEFMLWERVDCCLLWLLFVCFFSMIVNEFEINIFK